MQERKELCVALTAAQESAIVQLLLEVCLPTDQDKKVNLLHTVFCASSVSSFVSPPPDSVSSGAPSLCP